MVPMVVSCENSFNRHSIPLRRLDHNLIITHQFRIDSRSRSLSLSLSLSHILLSLSLSHSLYSHNLWLGRVDAEGEGRETVDNEIGEIVSEDWDREDVHGGRI